MYRSVHFSLMSALGAIVASAFLGGIANSQIVPTPFSYGTILDAGSPVFNRPDGGTPPVSLSGSAVSYGALFFITDTDGSYTLETTFASLSNGQFTDDDTFLVLYQNSFDPAAPLTNALAADDDGSPVGLLSLITANLTAGTSYFLVTTTFNDSVFGNITTRISGPAGSMLNLNAVPEPGSAAVLGLAALGLAFRRRKKQ